MSTAACLPIAADRAGPCVRTIFFRGLDLTGVNLALEMRLNPETPGPAQVALGMSATANAEGLRLAEVVVVAGVPISQVVLRIDKTTMKDATKVPYTGELGSASVLYYDLIGIFGQDERRLVYGTFTALPTVYGMDAAPASRPPANGFGAAGGGTWSSATLTFGDSGTTVQVDGADLLGAQVDKATAASASASADAARADAAAVASEANTYPGFDTKAALNAGSASIAEGGYANVWADETNAGAHVLYRKVSGAFVLITNFSNLAMPNTLRFLPQPVDENGGGSQVLWRRASPNGDGWGDITISTSASVITDPLGIYADNVYALFGFNMLASFGQRDPTKPTTTIRCEERYRGANTNYKSAFEYHLTTTPAGSPTEIRWFSAYGTHRQEDWNSSSWSWQFAGFTWFTPFGADVIEQWTPQGGDAGANGYLKAIVKKTVTLVANNAYAHTIQATRDGAGTIASPFVNARDELEFNAPAFIGGAPRTNIYGRRALSTTLIDTPVDGDSVLYGRMSGDPVTGTLYSRQHYADADQFVDFLFNGKQGGAVVQHLYALSGDAFAKYEAPSRTVSAGIRYADVDYVISRGGDLSDPLMRIDRATGRAGFAGPISKPIYTLDVLPNPTSVPPGTEAYCSNESGGGVPVFTDGTNWRRVTDRAVAA